MDTKKEIGKRLLKVRTILGKTQDEMADIIGISRSLYVGYENGTGKGNVSKKSVEKIQQSLNINPYWLQEGKGDMKLTKEYVQTDPDQLMIDKKNGYNAADNIGDLIKMNKDLVQQVSDLIKMQMLNAQTINNLSAGNILTKNPDKTTPS